MRIITILLIILLSGCASNQPNNIERSVTGLSEAEKLLSDAHTELSKGYPKKAIERYLNKLIELCDKRHDNSNLGSKNKTYAARGLIDTIYYMAMASADKQNAIAISPTCADGLYLKGYASLDLGKIEDAEKYINQAIEMSPVNSMYLSELGHIYQVKREWQKAVNIFTKSEAHAETFSPEEVKQSELLRAKRGIGFNLIELGDLDKAERKFKECLEIDSGDLKAANEIKYINDLRAKNSST